MLRDSDIALIAWFACISIVASIIQQIHDYTWWDSIIIAQFDHKQHSESDPELVIANGSIGLDLALYYIRQLCPTSANSLDIPCLTVR